MFKCIPSIIRNRAFFNRTNECNQSYYVINVIFNTLYIHGIIPKITRVNHNFLKLEFKAER